MTIEMAKLDFLGQQDGEEDATVFNSLFLEIGGVGLSTWLMSTFFEDGIEVATAIEGVDDGGRDIEMVGLFDGGRDIEMVGLFDGGRDIEIVGLFDGGRDIEMVGLFDGGRDIEMVGLVDGEIESDGVLSCLRNHLSEDGVEVAMAIDGALDVGKLLEIEGDAFFVGESNIEGIRLGVLVSAIERNA